jgi:hypothetical protein
MFDIQAYVRYTNKTYALVASAYSTRTESSEWNKRRFNKLEHVVYETSDISDVSKMPEKWTHFSGTYSKAPARNLRTGTARIDT